VVLSSGKNRGSSGVHPSGVGVRLSHLASGKACNRSCSPWDTGWRNQPSSCAAGKSLMTRRPWVLELEGMP